MLTSIRLLLLTSARKVGSEVDSELRLAGIFSNGEFLRKTIFLSFSVVSDGPKQQNKVLENTG
jgi:hypothetical protein